MKLKLTLTTAIAGMALALPSTSSASPPAPTFQDSVSLTGAPAVAKDPFQSFFDFTIFDLNATSGPNGENPSGLVRFDTAGGFFHIGGPVTCLAVNGNTATITFISNDPSSNFGGVVTIGVIDDQPDSMSFGPLDRAPTDCSSVLGSQENPLTNGDITVVDAQVPTTKDQCKGGGWKQFGFKNQGQCIAFVNHPHG